MGLFGRKPKVERFERFDLVTLPNGAKGEVTSAGSEGGKVRVRYSHRGMEGDAEIDPRRLARRRP